MSTMVEWLLFFSISVFVLTSWWFVHKNRRHARRLEDAPTPLAYPLVSLLIPARNEEEHLTRTLPLFLESDYEALEILILDDHSTDQTAEIVSRYQAQMPERLRLLPGAPLPDGYNGKSWACEQLAKAAKGKILLFCDADVSIGPRAITRTVSTLQHTGAGVVTAIPFQQMETWSERAIIPLVMHFATLGFVSLQHAFTSLSPRFTVANGQWLAFTKRCYEEIGGHADHKAEIVEDMALCKAAKRAGYRVCTTLAFADLSVRMYRSFGDVWEGFSKNLYALVGFRLTNFAIVGLFLMMTAILPWMLALLRGGLWWLPVFGLLWVRLSLANLARHPPRTILWHPLGTLLLMLMGVHSALRYYRGTLSWKGRILHAPTQTDTKARLL